MSLLRICFCQIFVVWEGALGRREGLPKTYILCSVFRQDDSSVPTQFKCFSFLVNKSEDEVKVLEDRGWGPDPD